MILRTTLLFVMLSSLLSSLMGTERTQIPVLNWTVGSDWINVRDHGVVGDGVADDTAALQALLSDLSDGDALYFPAGVYRITEELLIHKAEEKSRTEKRLMGNAFYGHGNDTVLYYDGAEGGVMLRIRGMLHYRMLGMVFDGGGKARVGMLHDNHHGSYMSFETHLYHAYVTMRDFTAYGILFGSFDGTTAGASAETVFQFMIFENCGTGIGFTNFNDYNFTFDGSIFRDNQRMGLECVNGNFYVRNSRFENNGLDMYANPEHSSSIRRTVSVGSGAFLQSVNSISPVTVENSLVVDWKDAYAITSRGAPMMVFDNVFENSVQKSAVMDAASGQKLFVANNTVQGAAKLLTRESATYTVTEFASTSPLTLNADEDFMPREVRLPGRHFDAKVDFGAVGDGIADDTDALQNAIDAARTHGQNAIAYLPRGTYRTTRTLHVDGGGYALGGSGIFCVVLFDGNADADAILVAPEGELLLDAFIVRRRSAVVYKAERPDRFGNNKVNVTDFNGAGVDIRQTASAGGSRVVYDTVYVTGKYLELPFHLGFRLDGLQSHDTVILHNTEGNLQVFDSGAATILHTVGYEGTVWLKGKARGGFFGIMTRLATLSLHSIYVEDSHPMVASDFYIEQTPPETVVLNGNEGDEPGRFTIGFVKIDRDIDLRGYRGEVNFLVSQYYGPPKSCNIVVTGEAPAINLVANYFYLSSFSVLPNSTLVNLLSSSGRSEFNEAGINLNAVGNPALVEGSIQDLRRLGLVDWQLNYPSLLDQ